MHQAETAGRGLQPRPKPLLSWICKTLRTGLQTPSGTSWINKNRQLRSQFDAYGASPESEIIFVEHLFGFCQSKSKTDGLNEHLKIRNTLY